MSIIPFRHGYDLDELPTIPTYEEPGICTMYRPVKAYKGLTRNAVATLVIPEGATVVVPRGSVDRVTPMNYKYRTDEAVVGRIVEQESREEILMAASPTHSFSSHFAGRVAGSLGITYWKGRRVTTDVNESIYTKCGSGINFCPTKAGARGWATDG